MLAGLPFKQQERISDLTAISKQLDDGLISPEAAASRLWSIIDDELRLSRESGLYRQVIELNGEEVLAEVVRLGMVALFFRTAEGTLGHAVRDGNRWTYVAYDASTDGDRRARAQVETLFELFQKQVRTGFYKIPNILPQTEAAQ